MKTADFITKAFNGTTKVTKCSSMFAENGAIYSYGYHYPLLFRVNGHAVRNITGYSNTTARHISWSRQVDAIDVHAGHGFRLYSSDELNAKALIEGAAAHVVSCQQRIEHHRAKGRRENTQVFQYMLDDLARAEQQLKAVQDIAA